MFLDVKSLVAMSNKLIGCSLETVGKSSKNSWSGTPASKWSNKLSIGTRVPLKTGCPPKIYLSIVMMSGTFMIIKVKNFSRRW